MNDKKYEANGNVIRVTGWGNVTAGRDVIQVQKPPVVRNVISPGPEHIDEVQRRILLGTYVLSAGYYDAYYTKAAQVRRLIADDFNAALEQCDFLLAPSCPITAWKTGEISDPLTAYKMDILTLSLNLAGLPGLCLPVGKGKDSGLPVGMQIMGRAFDEEGLIRVGSTLEGVLPLMGMPLL